MTNRKGSFIQTATGKIFWPLDPKPDEVCIQDIARALSMMCRFNGHVKKGCFYSIAEHSVAVAKNVSPENRLVALLHDATEAYSSDIARPLKKHLSGWTEIEHTIYLAIAEKFGLPNEIPQEVKDIDTRIINDERRCFLNECEVEWTQEYLTPLNIDLKGMSPSEAEDTFLSAFYNYSYIDIPRSGVKVAT